MHGISFSDGPSVMGCMLVPYLLFGTKKYLWSLTFLFVVSVNRLRWVHFWKLKRILNEVDFTMTITQQVFTKWHLWEFIFHSVAIFWKQKKRNSLYICWNCQQRTATCVFAGLLVCLLARFLVYFIKCNVWITVISLPFSVCKCCVACNENNTMKRSIGERFDISALSLLNFIESAAWHRVHRIYKHVSMGRVNTVVEWCNATQRKSFFF